jgi:acid stress-induced BolA-like protein IbaG/YrbA
MQAKIQEALEAEHVLVADVYGDGRHVNINVVSAAFEGKSSVVRQRMVYKVSLFIKI